MHSGDLGTVAGKRVPIVSVHDGEPGLLDNLGAVVGVRHEACAVRKHSKSGLPAEIYHFHEIDADAVIEACGKVLSETALEQVIVSESSLNEIQVAEKDTTHWSQLWPSSHTQNKH